MKLDRNINADGRGKYGLIKNRRLAQIEAWDGGEGEALDRQAVLDAVALLERAGVIDWGRTVDSEFMVIRLKDKYAGNALHNYAAAACKDDIEYAREIMEMAMRSGENHPNCKKPD